MGSERGVVSEEGVRVRGRGVGRMGRVVVRRDPLTSKVSHGSDRCRVGAL